MIAKLSDFFKGEPAVMVSLFMAVLGVLVSFGVSLSEDQTKALYSLLVILSGLIIRGKVTPTSKV